MLTFQYRQVLSLLILGSIVALLSSCALPYADSANAEPLAPTAISRVTHLPGAQAYTLSQVQTRCPAAHRARAALMLPLASGNQPEVVYSYHDSMLSMLKRYAVGSGKKTIILRENGASISDAQISSDGQFILFVSQVSSRPALQLIRMDGTGLQTLYCGDTVAMYINDLLWSPDQQNAVFESPNPAGAPAAPLINLFNLRTGTVQTLLSPSGNAGYLLRSWQGNTQVYMTGNTVYADSAPHDIYALNIQNKQVRQVALIEGANWDMSLTPNGDSLLLSQCAVAADQGTSLPPSIISAQSASGGVLQLIYASHVYAVTQIQAISAQTLLFIIGDNFSASPQLGLWKINLNGTGLLHLTQAGKALGETGTTWSSISRDGRFYAVMGYDFRSGNSTPSTLYYGALNGGTATKIATGLNGEDVAMVGWTTM